MMAMVLISFANAESLGLFKQGDTVNLIQGCTNSTYSNISKIYYPNNTIALNQNTVMPGSNGFYSYSFNNTFALGTYLVYGYCDEESLNTQWTYTFDISKNGFTLGISEAIGYGMLILIILLIVIISTIITIKLPYRNQTDAQTSATMVSYLKYVKLMMILITHAFMVWLLNILIALSDNYLNLTVYYGFVSFMFNMLMDLAKPLFYFIIVLAGWNLIKDFRLNKVNEELLRR